MKSSQDLRAKLRSIDHRGYPAYKDLKGQYDFGSFVLSIDHVQGDPFAAPSKLSIQVGKAQAGFPEEYYNTGYKKTALEDYLLRLFGKAVSKYTFQAEGSGKSGLISTSRCGQEVLGRTACRITDGSVLIRFEAGFPAYGRTINSPELRKIIFDYLPESCEEITLL